ncbi:subtilisin family serine protease [Saccharothrix ecbatanensis]|uniref:Subtilisin family serine protease n=1 Tax=Saccharothrix ecbatanensis TaxID=1105145 RepID=A0A7W9M053_9PSEU|nr:S8 family peptidase [Saccharothrix ecbatanensis]MBB5802377.1 subtilisin family serine protease [Saccharothrix ecbatanensis]
MGDVRGSRRALIALAGAAVTAMALATGATPAAAEGDILGANNPTAIKDSYIVVYNDVTTQSVDALTSDLSAKHDAKVDFTYRHALKGFAGTLSERAARRLAAEPGVAYVQQNGTVQATGTQPNPPSWGLDRIDQRNLPLDSTYTYPNDGTGVTAYIIDTGIRTTHSDFGGRASWGTNTVDTNNTDCNGHGTHVAGTVGGTAHGVAKGVRLIAVKVLNCQGSGSFAGVAAGIDWVTGHHTSGPAVANMSLGGQGSDTTGENAVRNSIADGVTYAIASGNSNANACNFTPARVAEAITVNASTNTDARASFSNWGTCTDIFAPGQNITSAWMTNDTATNTISGTSMAAPHVAGGAAVLLGATPSLTPAQVANAMVANSTLDKITSPGTGSPNRLLYVNTGDPGPGNPSVTPPGNQTGTVGTATSLQLKASGGAPPYTWSATGLPPGLTLAASTGLISGTPTTAGAYTVTVTATDTASKSASTTFTWTISPTGGSCSAPGEKLVNGGFESGTTGWSNATWTIGAWTGEGSPRTGSRSSWIGGYGYTYTETLSQTVTVPAGCANTTLSLWLKISTAEYEPAVFDTFTVKAGSTTLATYTNLNPSGYAVRTFNLGAYAGQSVTLSFTGAEDWSYQTSFVLDDVSVTAS